jgi:transcriptional regulator with PAS, ATPase and Fis domain
MVTFAADVARFHSEQLQKLFGEVQINQYSFEAGNIEKNFTEEMVIVSTQVIYDAIRSLIPGHCEVVVTTVTLSQEGLHKIRDITPGSKVMLVNLSAEMCMEAISLIYQVGISHIELVPVYPGMKKIPNLDMAITPNEGRYVPSRVKTVIDIGHRGLDVRTIVEIALKLKMGQLLHTQIFQDYFASIVDNYYNINALAGQSRHLETQFEILLKALEEGIIGINSQGIIFAYNDGAEKILGVKRGGILGQKICEHFPEIPVEEAFCTNQSIKSKLIQWRGVHLNVEIALVTDGKRVAGAFAIVKKFSDMEQQHHLLRLQLVQKGYRAKYTFADIIGESEIMVQTKALAYKMAKTDLAVLIFGESGSGKELFAQAIHNESKRKEYPFVAVNCAAIPENLLESELFGYEEGAFTGAKKGGKRGVFEFAHQGTLFLDEIGEMSLGLQAKLLRILQEKEVVRVGGDRVIKVDVRVIAATNENLRELVNQGRFRRDLYYRMRVLPLRIPPLRKRGGDILLLAEEFQREMGSKVELPSVLKSGFLRHNWEGNVRELRSYVECISYIGFHESLFSDLSLFADESPVDLQAGKRPHIRAASLQPENLLDFFVLEELLSCRGSGEKAGRRSLARRAHENGITASEQEIRTVLDKLEAQGFISVARGRSGSRITDKGIQYMVGRKG